MISSARTFAKTKDKKNALRKTDEKGIFILKVKRYDPTTGELKKEIDRSISMELLDSTIEEVQSQLTELQALKEACENIK